MPVKAARTARKTARSTPAALRFRPLGLTLAILATALGYGLIPMLPVLLVLWTALTGREIGLEMANTPLNWLGVLLGVAVLVACVFAWWGRPRGVRRALLILVWLSTAFMLYRVGLALTSAPSLGQVGGSLSSGMAVLLCQGPVLVFVPLYVTWYLNRAPARAFYGHGGGNPDRT
ncbi:MAG: hypothetical protein IT323_03300 [Anaerolineae bacterium]|nr:hypothetical protein [Anaerolineae bacterium]